MFISSHQEISYLHQTGLLQATWNFKICTTHIKSPWITWSLDQFLRMFMTSWTYCIECLQGQMMPMTWCKCEFSSLSVFMNWSTLMDHALMFL
jgi:hypothetical protein